MSLNKTVEDSSIDFEFNFYKSLYKKLPNDKRLLSILAECIRETVKSIKV